MQLYTVKTTDDTISSTHNALFESDDTAHDLFRHTYKASIVDQFWNDTNHNYIEYWYDSRGNGQKIRVHSWKS